MLIAYYHQAKILISFGVCEFKPQIFYATTIDFSILPIKKKIAAEFMFIIVYWD